MSIRIPAASTNASASDVLFDALGQEIEEGIGIDVLQHQRILRPVGDAPVVDHRRSNG